MREKLTKRNIFLGIIILEFLVLIVLVCIAANAGKTDTTESSTGTSASTTTENGESPPPETTQTPPTETEQTTSSSKEEEEQKPVIYTREELEAMDKTVNGWGPGKTSGGKRPPYADPEQQKYEQYGANFIAPDTNKVYLTFDCGYEYSYKNSDGKTVRVTEWILDTLKEKNVKAIFFVTMSYCKDNADIVQRMINEGHTVGNHSTTHPNMAKLSIDEMISEVMTLHNYVKANFNYEMHYFRPPEGAYSQQSLAVVHSLGYETVHWSFAYADWDPEAQPDVKEAYETVTGRHHNGAIYLLHAVSVTNATILGDVIDFLQGQGYELELFK